MPIIPFVDEGQRMVPGSPVPIGGEKEARLSGEATAALGQAMFNLGDALDLAARKAKDDKDKLDEMEAFTKFRKEQQKQQAVAYASGLLEDDNDGTKAVGVYQEPLGSVMSEIADGISDDGVRRRFKIRAEDLVADTSMQVLANTIEKRTKDNEIKRGRIVSDINDSAKDDPANLPIYLGEVEKVFANDGALSDAARPLMVTEAKKGVVRGAINEQVLKGQISGKDQNFNTALKILDSSGKGLFDDKERKAIADEIFQEQYKTDGRLLQKETKRQAMLEKSRQKHESDLMGIYSAQLTIAGNSDIARGPVLAEIEKDILAGNISEAKGRSLIGARTFLEPADDKYEADLLSKTILKGTYRDAIVQIQKDKGVKVSNDRATRMLDDLNKMKERTEKDPMKTQLIQDGEELLKSYMAESLTDPLNSLEKRALQAKVTQTVGQYHKALIRNPEADPMSVAQSLYERNYRTPLQSLRSRGSVFDTSSAERTDGSIQSLLKQYSEEKSKGLVPKGGQRDKYYIEQLQILNTHKKKFIKLDPLKPVRGQQGTGDVAPGARGK